VQVVLRFCTGDGSNRTARRQRDHRHLRQNERAPGEVLEHLALRAIVISRVRRAAGNIGRIMMVVTLRQARVRRALFPFVRGRVLMRCQFYRDPRQRAERRPSECDQRAADHPRTPATERSRVGPGQSARSS